jgi:hypothetical protein
VQIQVLEDSSDSDALFEFPAIVGPAGPSNEFIARPMNSWEKQLFARARQERQVQVCAAQSCGLK